MTRALFVTSGNMYGGVERVLETVAGLRHLCPSMDPRFALCFEGTLAESLRAARVDLDILGRVRVTRPDLVLRARARLAENLRANRPDVVLTQSAWSHVIFAPVVRRMRIPLALWVHDELSGKPWLEKLAARHQPDLIVCNSAHTERAARAVFPSVPAAVVHYPLAFNAVPGTRQEVRRRHSTPEDAAVIINVARMEPYKGQHTLIDALGRMKTTVPWACWIVGGAQRPTEVRYEQSLRDAVAARGLQDRIRFLGLRHDVMALLAAADVHCHPNQGAEPFGIAIVEALQMGLPVVATNLGGPAEIVTPECGLLVPVGDSDALADALSSLVSAPEARRRLSTSGPARALELCDPAPRLQELNIALRQLSLRAAA